MAMIDMGMSLLVVVVILTIYILDKHAIYSSVFSYKT